MCGFPLSGGTAPGEGVDQGKAQASTLTESLEGACPPSRWAGALEVKQGSRPDQDQLLEDTFPGARGVSQSGTCTGAASWGNSQCECGG